MSIWQLPVWYSRLLSLYFYLPVLFLFYNVCNIDVLFLMNALLITLKVLFSISAFVHSSKKILSLSLSFNWVVFSFTSVNRDKSSPNFIMMEHPETKDFGVMSLFFQINFSIFVKLLIVFISCLLYKTKCTVFLLILFVISLHFVQSLKVCLGDTFWCPHSLT